MKRLQRRSSILTQPPLPGQFVGTAASTMNCWFDPTHQDISDHMICCITLIYLVLSTLFKWCSQNRAFVVLAMNSTSSQMHVRD